MRKSLLGETLVLSWYADKENHYVVYRDIDDTSLNDIQRFINDVLKQKEEVTNWVLSRHIVSSDY